MRILLAAGIANAPRTGMGKWAHCIAEALRHDGHHVTLWFGEDTLRSESASAKVLLYPVLLAVAIIRNRHLFDVVIVHEPGGFWYGVARKILPSLPPMIAMCHNVESKWF